MAMNKEQAEVLIGARFWATTPDGRMKCPLKKAKLADGYCEECPCQGTRHCIVSNIDADAIVILGEEAAKVQ